MNEIKIEKKVALPSLVRNQKNGLSSTLIAMEIGDSFVFPAIKQPSLYAAISYQRQTGKSKGKKFTARRISSTEIRCWRVE